MIIWLYGTTSNWDNASLLHGGNRNRWISFIGRKYGKYPKFQSVRAAMHVDLVGGEIQAECLQLGTFTKMPCFAVECIERNWRKKNWEAFLLAYPSPARHLSPGEDQSCRVRLTCNQFEGVPSKAWNNKINSDYFERLPGPWKMHTTHGVDARQPLTGTHRHAWVAHHNITTIMHNIEITAVGGIVLVCMLVMLTGWSVGCIARI